MKSTFRKKFIYGASIGFLFWLTGALLFHFKLNVSLNASAVEEFQEKYIQRINQLNDDLLNYQSQLKTKSTEEEKFDLGLNISEKTGSDFFVYHQDSLVLWTNNRIDFPTVKSDEHFESGLVFLDNGWFQSRHTHVGDSIIIGVFKIKNQFKHENEDLSNAFSEDLITDFPAELSLEDEGFAVVNADGEREFSVVPLENMDKNEGLEITIFFCYLIGFVILLQLMLNATQKLLIKRPILLIIYPLTIVVLRYLWLSSDVKGIMADFELFNPELFASSIFAPSLGDLIINITMFYFFVHFLLKRTRDWFKEGNKKLKLVIFIMPLFIVSFFAAFKINDIIYSLVYDSKLSFDLERLFDFSIYSFLSITVIGASFYAYFKLIQYIIIQLKNNEFEWNRLAFLWALSSGIYIIIDLVYFDHSFLTSLWPILLSGALLWFQFKEKAYKFVHVISMVAFIAFYAAYILEGYSENNERELRIAQAELIAKDKDFFSEFDYDNAERKLIKEDAILPFFDGEFNQSAFSEELEENYFKKLKNDFDLTFYLFGADKRMVVDYGNYELKDYSRFEEIIAQSGERIDSTNLYFIKDYTDKLTYISKFPVLDSDTIRGYLVTELRSKKFPEDIGLPSLLLDKGTNTLNRLKNYSIAKYVDDKLVTRKGDYAYPTTGTEWDASNSFVNLNGFSHFIYEEEQGYTTVISKKLKSNLSLFTSFSYLLIIFGVLLLIPLGFKQFQSGVSFKNIKLNVKIQTVLIGLILVTLVAFAVGAGAFVKDQYTESNTGFITEKLGSVKTELESKLKKEEELKGDIADYLEYLLKKFSKVFVTDINLFNTDGDLLASSQPKIYSKGLISRKMNTLAFQEIHLQNKSEFVHTENIGRLNYLSAYTPFFNQKGEFLAYLNVQYISRQDQFEDQISAFLLAIINIMVLMLAISTILAIIVSNRLTRPLKYIQDSLRNVQIGAKYKPIKYEGTDEIGELVREYNLKVGELQKNAEALAKSERESAWREMAKQVAHEIKNPLTPMKLSIQHLKRSVKVADDESADKLDRVTKSLIEQIDALTKIANEFSNFAKMPKANESELNLTEIVESAVAVFSEYDEHHIELINSVKEDAIIWADKDLLLRVFNNLIKNAIQAAGVDQSALVKITISHSADTYEVAVQDNGVGIAEEAQEKIFVPYFTTKSKGTGLGLAMSKQIVENMKGNIRFESKLNEGTTFYVTFPKYNN
ncbi:MAG: HAMP domain-containing sensor histidine kinase [Crocinitomicaceae bacterium]